MWLHHPNLSDPKKECEIVSNDREKIMVERLKLEVKIWRKITFRDLGGEKHLLLRRREF